ncbi:hypothetical protein PoB_005081600 [Plakobranchus ocellatus]|uniref:Zasp-like motif domain-containing protein n=1 Tax=Plakobranchus ocellatus TaxID=259542 RepID=A0AAV4BLZ4_9GAST|nr:hypothetical protein PoB_005081600 [Plakobranchus ocellatus]
MLRNGVGIDASTPTTEHQGTETRREEQRGEDKYETGRASWGSRSCPTGHSRDSPPQEVLNSNGLDSPHQPQRVVNPNGLVPPRQPQKVVNPSGLDPPEQQKLKEKLDLVASEGDTGMQHQEIASGKKRFIICTGERKEIGVSNTNVAKWNDRCFPDGYLKYGQPRKALNANELDPLHQAQKVINSNEFDPPYKPQKLVNRNSLDPPYQPQRVINPNALDPPDPLRRSKDHSAW